MIGPAQQAALSGLAGSVQCVLACNVRNLTVFAWGRNVEGQCAIEGPVPLVTRPTAVLELLQAPVSSVVASKLTSGAVVGGAVYTWGEGAAGKLGHGSAASLTVPSRVEALVGRSPISAAALGHHHSLFVDQAGSLWACGENKEGQCGFGTPLDVIAVQHRRAQQQEALMPLAAAAQGHVGVPARVGAGPCSMMSAAAAAATGDAAAAAAAAAEAAQQLGSAEVVAVAASSYFSLALTAKGEVWTFGADYNGALGSEGSSWQSSPCKGRLWLWGRLVDQQHGAGIMRRFGGEDGQQHHHHQQQQVLAASSGGADYSWAGFGGHAPQLVRELSGVKDVALGGWHALVLAE
ncbi:hypothetical protein OEZ85_014076 [Tetradesmus obliquus]|uniref:Uncharacterized protein n=1 Tax=Tetradesmus obliquus TaxID=3088 RepID=A0ABY8UBZ3_TETOB|nr:hypothetical protein OEZ85_014076 [Tetradesmus obliquus]